MESDANTDAKLEAVNDEVNPIIVTFLRPNDNGNLAESVRLLISLTIQFFIFASISLISNFFSLSNPNLHTEEQLGIMASWRNGQSD